jgi:uncharacterized membrane protein
VPLEDDHREAAQAELARRRLAVWIVALCFVGSVIAATSVTAWFAILLAVLGAVVTTMAIARYRHLVAAVEQADR